MGILLPFGTELGRAIASFGSKELIDPEKGRKVFQQIEKKARHQLGRYSRPFPAANAHFVPWDHVPELIDRADCELRPGDLVILASDGIETLSTGDLAELLQRNPDSTPDVLARLIIDGIEQRDAPRQDNVTAIVYRHS